MSAAPLLLRKGLARLREARRLRRLGSGFAAAAAALPGSAAYARLHAFSLALCGWRADPRAARHLNLVLPELPGPGVFAGVHTALRTASELARRAGLPLRIVTLHEPGPRAALSDWLSREFAPGGPLVAASELAGAGLHPGDAWIATHWTTGHALDVAHRLGHIEAARVIYLIQDYEPGFSPWSSDFALARASYHAGFHALVNSAPLAQYLRAAEGLAVDEGCVFAPRLDLPRLDEAARERRRAARPRLLFYARPDKPRNLWAIGLAALTLLAERLAAQGRDMRFASAGAPHEALRLSPRHTLQPLGRLAWDDYFRALAGSDIVLSLQLSPHPSHPPLDAVCSGAIAVSNELAGTRAGLHPRLLVAEPDPQALAERLEAALRLHDEAPGPAGFDADWLARLGVPAGEALGRLLPVLG